MSNVSPPRTGRPLTVVDWQAAAALAGRITPPGPRLTRNEAVEVVAGLREAAVAAVAPILETTQMRPAPGLPQDSFGQIKVIDRAGWSATNLAMMSGIADPALAQAAEALPVTQVTKAGAAAEVAAMMAILAPRVLGQFDPYSELGNIPASNLVGAAGVGTTTTTPHLPQGQLLLVAPNVAQVERALKVDPDDFRLWVCLHEQTHGLQFAAAPWLAPYLYGQISGLLAAVTERTVETTQGSLWQRFKSVLELARDMFNSVINTDGPGPVEALLGPAQRQAFDTISATMALLEGHADVMMDEVGPEVIPTVALIRERFEKRRDGEGQAKAGVLVRRAMGMDTKLAQYRDGAVFVRGVEALVGRAGFNEIWAGPENLPTPGEIANPAEWVRRVTGG